MMRLLPIAFLAISVVCCTVDCDKHLLQTAQAAEGSADDVAESAVGKAPSGPVRFSLVESAVPLPEGVTVLIEKCPAKTRQARLAILSTGKRTTYYVFELSLTYDGQPISVPDQIRLERMIVVWPNELVVFPVRFAREVYTDPDVYRREHNVDPFNSGARVPRVRVSGFKVVIK